MDDKKRVVSLSELLPLMEDAFARGQDMVLPVTGGSMRPTLLPDGDTVTLSACEPSGVCRGDICLYRRANGQFVLHRVIRAHPETLDFCGDAQVKVERDIPKTALCGVVTAYCHHGHTLTGQQAVRQAGKGRLCSRPLRAVATAWHRLIKGEKA